MHPTRRALLTGTTALAAGALLRPAPVRAAVPRRLVVVMATGGWDVSYCFDPKLGVDGVDGPDQDEDPENPDDREAIHTFGGLPLVVNPYKRPAVSAFFDRWHDRSAVVNGIWMGSVGHVAARTRLLTGSTDGNAAGWATIAGQGLATEQILGLVDLSGRAYIGELGATTGQIGATGQLRVLVDDATRFPPVDGAAPAPIDAEARGALDTWLSARTTTYGATTGRFSSYPASRLESMSRATRLRLDGPGLLAGLVPGVPADFATQAAIAVELLQNGLCAAVTLDSRIDWDTHARNADQHAAYQSLFSVLDGLVADLDASGTLDDTLVAVVSDFTRTPLSTAGGGKNHWPHGSALFVGGPARGDRVFGGTDDQLQSLAVDPDGGLDPSGEVMRYDHLAAGILAGLGVDPEPWYPGITPYLAPFSA
ncbi:MAG: DUF1501 domain-containing protein [Myxococcota bacterium]